MASEHLTRCDQSSSRPIPPDDLPIPNGLNTAILIIVVAGAIALLWLGSYLDRWYEVLLVGIAFSYLMLTDYALLHESAHGNLHSNYLPNRVLGTIAGFLFPCPYSLLRASHQGHHLRNRTDYEMFDLYYDGDSRLVRYVQWYGILCGFFWPWIPLGAVLFSLCPSMLRARIFQRARSSSYLLGDIRTAEIRAIRLETLANIVLFAGLFWALNLRWQNTLVLYACFAFNWSTRQYVGHAFSKRDVVDGAWNLRHNRLMSFLLLHNEWDLNHHRRPDVPWLYLPKLGSPKAAERSYVRQYLRLWTGPRLATEPAPESLDSLPLSIHSEHAE
jgi:fatty acid desaturase